MNAKFIFFTTLTLLLASLTSVWSQTVYFDDSNASLLKLGNTGHYEIAFQKTNGGVSYILDQSTGKKICAGANSAYLWSIYLPDNSPTFLGSTNYSKSGGTFIYAWDAAAQTLTMNFTPKSSQPQIATQVAVTASEDAYFDMSISVQNTTGHFATWIGFPTDLLYPIAEMKSALLPILPGVVLQSGFFTEGRTFTRQYPGWPGLFADFMQLETTSGNLAVYTLNLPSQPLLRVTTGFSQDSWIKAGHVAVPHTFEHYVGDGESWQSPVVRFRVGETRDASVLAMRADNQIDTYPSIQEKLAEKFTAVAASPLLKADFPALFNPWSLDRNDGMLAFLDLLYDLPSPSIFHPVAFHEGYFDTNYPDFLNIAQELGTLDDLAEIIDQAHALGLLVMPYTNPTWWDESSLTMQTELGDLSRDDIAVHRSDGSSMLETYNNNDGVVVSPHHPFVINRIDRLLQDLQDIHFDMVFEDQVGARPGMLDYNPSSPNPSAYLDGWFEHSKKHTDKLLCTEMGFDRLAETEWSFYGSLLLFSQRGETEQWWGENNWSLYPFASMVLGDKILLYQHNLAWETATHTLAKLTWNLANGYMLMYDLVVSQNNAPEMLPVVGAFQKHVAAKYAGKCMQNFVDVAPGVTRSTFENLQIVANWQSSPLVENNHTIAADGFLATSTDGYLTAGAFTAFNGAELSDGLHYLIVEQAEPQADADDQLCVWQPLGANTPLKIMRPAAWTQDAEIHAYAVSKSDTLAMPFTLHTSSIEFTCSNIYNGKKVDHYLFTHPSTATAVQDEYTSAPQQYSLAQNYPNPFNPSTQIAFTLPATEKAKLTVYDVLGHEVAVLLDRVTSAGSHAVTFHAENLASGIYLYQLTTANSTLCRSMLLIK